MATEPSIVEEPGTVGARDEARQSSRLGEEWPSVARLPVRRDSFARASLLTFAATSATLGMNLVTGILIARALGPQGRGALTAVLAALPIMAWVFEMGSRQAISYHQARRPSDAPRLISTWLVLSAPLALAALISGEALLPHLLSAQGAHTLFLARVLMLSVVFVFLSDLIYGVLLGDHDFRFYNFMRVAQPVAIAVGYVVLWRLGLLSVTTAAAVTCSASLVDTAVVTVRALRRHGLGKPSLKLAKSTFWFGVRAHGTATAGVVNTRLDLMITPAFLSAASVGLYSAATNVSWIVVTVSGSLASLVLPTAAASSHEEGSRTVLSSLYATLGVGLLVAGALAAVAGVGVRIVYGPAFAGSVEPLRILLIGSVLYAGATVLFSGLYAINRPFTAALSQIAGAVVTVVGLVLFLRSGGIWAAAIISTISYALVFVLAFALYRRAADLSWRHIVPSRELVQAWARDAVRTVRARAA
ncbi:MAG: oligosaccharide flippase family protein [Gaiellaceae bacterium]